MKWFLLGVCSLLLKPQDEEKIKQTIVAEVPDFYVQTYSLGYNREYLRFLNLPPEKVSRKYHIKNLSDEGEVSKNFKEFTEEEFYKLAVYVLGYGARDNDEFSYYFNEGYKNFVKLLLEHDIIANNGLTQFSKMYQKRSWVESMYCLDEAVEGFWKDGDWQKVISKTRFYSYCFPVLIDIKNGKPLNDIRKGLDKAITEKESWSGCHFKKFGKSYAELVRKGANFPEDAQLRLFSSFMDWDPDFDLRLRENYLRAGLPLPEKTIISRALLERVRISLGEPLSRALERFRNLGVEFPKECAPLYRDALLKDFGNFEDILYLIKLAEQDATPDLWKKYADRAFHWYSSKENRKIHNDSGDYYHAAIEGYRRAAAGGIKVNKAITDSLIEQGTKDLCVHTRDLIVAYELAGENPKSSYILEKLEERIEKLKSVAVGIVYNGNSEATWLTSEYGQKLLPFQEEIELAAYLGLNDPERIRNLADKISRYEIEKLKKEAPELAKQAAKLYKRPLNELDFLTVIYNRIIFTSAMRKLDTPVYLELSAIMDLCENLGFKIGARSLAQYLMEVGFIVPARRGFHLGGLGKEAEEQFYSKHDNAYWNNKQADYSEEMRKEAIRRPPTGGGGKNK